MPSPLRAVPVTAWPAGLPQRTQAERKTLARTGLRLPRRLSFEAWLALGRQLSIVADSSAWCLGDWLIYGENVYPGRYRYAIERTSLDYKTLRNYAWVARRFPVSRRRDMLSFGHHAEVAGLPQPEQDYWLRKAEEFGWSRNQTRREVRASLMERKCAADGGTVPSAERAGDDTSVTRQAPSILLEFTADQFEACREAASQQGCSVQEWAVLTLCRAARHHRCRTLSECPGTHVLTRVLTRRLLVVPRRGGLPAIAPRRFPGRPVVRPFALGHQLLPSGAIGLAQAERDQVLALLRPPDDAGARPPDGQAPGRRDERELLVLVAQRPALGLPVHG